MVIQESDGSIGIGTNTPSQQLHLAKSNAYILLESTYAAVTDGAMGSEIDFLGTDGAVGAVAGIRGAHLGTNTDHNGMLRFYTTSGAGNVEGQASAIYAISNGAERVRIDSDGMTIGGYARKSTANSLELWAQSPDVAWITTYTHANARNWAIRTNNSGGYGYLQFDYSSDYSSNPSTVAFAIDYGGNLNMYQHGIYDAGNSDNYWNADGMLIEIPTESGEVLTDGLIVRNANYPVGRTIIGQYSGEPHMQQYASGGTLVSRVSGVLTNYFLNAVRIGVDNDTNAIDNASNVLVQVRYTSEIRPSRTSSDERLKTGIRPTQANALDLVNKFNIVDFEWDDPTDTVYYGKNYRGTYTGMVAQETVEIAPWIINDQGGGRDCDECLSGNECEEHGMWHVEYQHLVPTLVKAIQELSKELEEVRKDFRESN